MRERGMYWDDLRALIRRNAHPRSDIRYYYNPKMDPTVLNILDYNIIRRKPGYLAETGYSAEDHFRDSLICHAAFFNGEIPMQNNKGAYGSTAKGSEFEPKPYRGALGVLEALISEGCLERTDELRRLFARHERRLPDLF